MVEKTLELTWWFELVKYAVHSNKWITRSFPRIWVFNFTRKHRTTCSSTEIHNLLHIQYSMIYLKSRSLIEKKKDIYQIDYIVSPNPTKVRIWNFLCSKNDKRLSTTDKLMGKYKYTILWKLKQNRTFIPISVTRAECASVQRNCHKFGNEIHRLHS